MKELFTGIDYLFKEIHTKKKETRNVEKQYHFLDDIQKNNHKLLSINIEKKDTNSLQVVNYNYSVNYIIGINFTKSNTHAYVTDSEGRLKFYCSAGVLQHSGKNKKSRFQVLKNIYRILVTRLIFLKDEPVALHLKNVGFSTTSIVKKLKRIAFIVAIKDFSVVPFNGCRLRKVPRKRVKKSMAKKKPVRINAILDMGRSLIKVVKKQRPDYWNVYKSRGKFMDLKLNENSSAKFVSLKTNKRATVKKLFDWAAYFFISKAINCLNFKQNVCSKYSEFNIARKQQCYSWDNYLKNSRVIESTNRQFFRYWFTYLKVRREYRTTQKILLVLGFNKSILKQYFNHLVSSSIKLRLQNNLIIKINKNIPEARIKNTADSSFWSKYKKLKRKYPISN